MSKRKVFGAPCEMCGYRLVLTDSDDHASLWRCPNCKWAVMMPHCNYYRGEWPTRAPDGPAYCRSIGAEMSAEWKRLWAGGAPRAAAARHRVQA
jgi:hypothetical protein